MKIEPFPWLRDYYIDMDKLYTELILEKIEYEVLGPKMRKLKDYKEMFDTDGRDKILAKGEAGMGKTTLGKKVGWDWARGVCGKFSIMLVVFLKSVQPGEKIENVIIRQNPELKGIGVTAAKLRCILDKFGDRCLLILDGLDEHGLGKNEDVLNIIRNEKLLNCGIIVSSRPHTTREIEIHFSTVIRVDGFNEEEAERFVSNVFKDDKKINQIMLFKPSDTDYEYPIQKCPILLSFFCFLVAEKEIDLSDETINVGLIYTRLVKCLYKKYTIRKSIVYEAADFYRVVKSVGQLALKTLTSGNPVLQRREVLRVVGDFAFEYGLFAGHEDIRLVDDQTADIYVTYPHRSLEEFFGSFGFIDALRDGKSVDDILGPDCKEPIFMMNPLVFKFFLWFLSSEDFDFPQRDECYDKLTSYVAKRIDTKVFDPEEIRDRYPVIDMVSLPAFSIQFFRDVLNKCKQITTLQYDGLFYFAESENIEEFLSLVNRDFIDRLTTIILGNDYFKLKNIDNNSLTLSINAKDDEALAIMNLLLQKYSLSERNPQIYAFIFNANLDNIDITIMSSKHSKELHFAKEISGEAFSLIASNEFSPCPILTDLCFTRSHIDESVPAALRRALQSGKLPSLRRVRLIDCCKLEPPLDWPNEVELSVIDDIVVRNDESDCYICFKLMR